ncbi:MAG: hypothetical protein J6A94_03340 [Lachnospiraceae bacterium]|nr:hypothetical protein [Lachnospiraceae bacterium]
MKQTKRFLAALLTLFLVFGGVFADLGDNVVIARAEENTGAVEITSEGLKTGTDYGTPGIIGIYVLDEMGHKSATVSLEDGSSISGYVVGKNNPKPGKGDIVEKGAAIKLVPELDCTVSLVVRSNAEKTFYFVTQAADGSVTSVTEDESGVDGKVYKRFTYELKAGNTYYAYRNGSKASFAEISYTYSGTPVGQTQLEEVELVEGLVAFEGAEGGGMYATGGRGGDVYVVTNLEDYGPGENKIEGSLRYGVETSPTAGRIIVFNVGGTIHLKDTLSLSGKKNLTIAGQTAPGEGITIGGADTNISDSENLIIRFVHFRVGTENLLSGGDSFDALWGRDNSNFIIDHCSFSWSTDETLSTYRGKDGTVQWCIISESLTVSGHSKGRHGYGGIWGGDNTVFQYNLISDHTSRNPRIGGGSMTDPTKEESFATVQLSNNVAYNYGFYVCYGGGYAYTNYINNYLKTGPGTRDSIQNTLIDYGEDGKKGGVYLDGNVVENESGIITDNTVGVDITGDTTWATEKYTADAFDTVTLVSAEEAYDKVLAQAGATYPKRDAIDARVVAHVDNGTGYYINTQDEIGGYCAPEVYREESFDTDMDGIPDAWETANGLNPSDNTDSRKLNKEGYAWVEVYFNELVEDVVAANYKAKNPDVSIDLTNNTLLEEGKDVTVTASPKANNGGSIAKVEFFKGNELVGTIEAAPYSYIFKGLPDGTYDISVRAIDNDGNATQSETSKLHVNSTAGTGEWESVDIGNHNIPGTASLDADTGVMTIKSSGRIGKSEGNNKELDAANKTDYSNGTNDDFHYVYQSITGDGEIIAKLDEYLVVDNHSFNGVMFREDLTPDAASVGVGLSMVKIENSTVWSAFMIDRDKTGGDITTIGGSIDSASAAEKAGIPMIQDLNFKEGNTFNGTWLKLLRKGDTFNGFVSEDGMSWRQIGTMDVKMPETIYVGLAVDAAKVANDIDNYATAKFSGVEVNTEWVSLTYDVEDVEVEGPAEIALGKDVVIQFTNATGYDLPKNVKVTNAGGAEVDFVYQPSSGLLTLENVTENLTIAGEGETRVVEAVTFEEVDEGNLLTVEEKDGKLVLTQTASSGQTAKDSKTAPVNQSFILFPETKKPQTLSMTLKITEFVKTADEKNTGVFVGAYAVDNHAFTTLGFRAYENEKKDSLSAYWTKADDYVGNGSPKFQAQTGVEYKVTFTTNAEGQYQVNFEAMDGSVKASDGVKNFKVNENFMQQGEKVRMGIGIIGATVEISDLTLVDYEGNEIYPGKNLSANQETDIPVEGESLQEESGNGVGIIVLLIVGCIAAACGITVYRKKKGN